MNRQELAQKTVLVVDDFEAMRTITTQQLRHCGISQVLTARDGAEAHRLLETHHVDLVISDWNMPTMDGLQLLEAIRCDMRLRNLPFVMMTAESEREALQQVIAAGVSGLLIKPYTASRFLDGVLRAFAWQPTALPRETDSQSAASPPARSAREGGVLIVDSQADSLAALVPLFSERYRVRTVMDGERALAICGGEDPPDLVLLDVGLPGMDGFAVAGALRAHPNTGHLPIIFIGTQDDLADRIESLGLDAVDFVLRPLDTQVLRLRVGNFMRQSSLHRRMQGECNALLEVARLRDEVAQMLRHDLKAPLTGIVGLADLLLEEGRFSEQQASYVRSIDACAHQLLNMIGLSSELYKIESGRFVLDPVEFDLLEMVRGVAEVAQGESRSRRLGIAVHGPAGGVDGERLPVAGDPVLTRSLLHNLLRNACEAAPADSTIEVQVAADAVATVAITNAGVAPPEVRERFFEKYVTAGKRGGTGLGTYSARRFAEAQGGGISASFDDARGTTRVVVSLPRLHAEDELLVRQLVKTALEAARGSQRYGGDWQRSA